MCMEGLFLVEKDLSGVSRQVGVEVDDLTSGKGELRDTAICLVKKYTGLTNRQNGEIFGGLSY